MFFSPSTSPSPSPTTDTVEAIGMKGLLAIPVWAGLVALPLAMTVGGMVRKAPESETIKTLLDSKIFWKLIYDLLFTI